MYDPVILLRFFGLDKSHGIASEGPETSSRLSVYSHQTISPTLLQSFILYSLTKRTKNDKAT